MAFNLGGIFVRLGLDPSAFNRGIDSAGRGMDDLGRRARNAGRSINDGLGDARDGARGALSVVDLLGGSFGRLAIAGLAISGVSITFRGIAGEMAKAVEIANQLEVKLNALGRATQTTGAERLKWRDSVRGMSSRMGVPIEELFDVATGGAKLGYKGKELEFFVQSVAKAKIAIGEMGAADISDALGKIDASFRYGASGSAGMASAVQALASEGASSEKGLFNTIARVAPMAKQFGFSPEQTAAMASSLMDTGFEAERASTGIGKLMQTVLDPRSSIRDSLLRQLKLTPQEMEKALQESPFAVLQLMLKRLKSLDSQGSMKALQEIGLGSTEEMSAVLAVAGNVDVLAERIRIASKEFETLGALNRNFDQNAETNRNKLLVAENKSKIIYEDVGNGFQPAQIEMVTMAGEVMAAFDELFLKQKNGAQNAGEAMVTAARLARAAFQSFVPVIQRVVDAFAAFGTAIESVGKLGNKDFSIRNFADSVIESRQLGFDPFESLKFWKKPDTSFQQNMLQKMIAGGLGIDGKPKDIARPEMTKQDGESQATKLARRKAEQGKKDILHYEVNHALWETKRTLSHVGKSYSMRFQELSRKFHAGMKTTPQELRKMRDQSAQTRRLQATKPLGRTTKNTQQQLAGFNPNTLSGLRVDSLVYGAGILANKMSERLFTGGDQPGWTKIGERLSGSGIAERQQEVIFERARAERDKGKKIAEDSLAELKVISEAAVKTARSIGKNILGVFD